MSFNAIGENKIIAKISEFTVISHDRAVQLVLGVVWLIKLNPSA